MSSSRASGSWVATRAPPAQRRPSSTRTARWCGSAASRSWEGSASPASPSSATGASSSARLTSTLLLGGSGDGVLLLGDALGRGVAGHGAGVRGVQGEVLTGGRVEEVHPRGVDVDLRLVALLDAARPVE